MSLRDTARFGLLAIPLTVFALSACGGGGSNSTVPPTQPTSSPTATPAPNPTASGDTFAYTGSLTQTFTLYGTPAPSPSPSASPEPTSTPWVSTTQQTVTQNVSIATGQSFAGQSGLTELAAQESDASQLRTTSLTSQTYLSYAQNSSRANGVDVTEIGTASTDSNGVSLQSAPASGNGILERLPSVYGEQWSNGAARTDTEKDPGGEASTSTYAADGSYNEHLTYAEGASASVQLNSDASGVYQLPFVGNGNNNSSITVAAPAGGQIQLAYALLPPGLPHAGAFTLPVWYPQDPPVLASDAYVDEGATALPSSCKVASTYQSASVEKIVETKKRLDPVFGELESDEVTQYASPTYGLLCAVVSDDLQTYYDYSGQGPAAFTFSARPLRDTTVSEMLALQSANLKPMSAAARRSDTAQSQISPRPSLARARMILAGVHAQHVRALYQRVHALSRTRQQ
ncbi:MAG TPA: hypothetical protein VJP85_13925 [Candidatus Baltobacteraceae bacterium]|nr:hypothetical protein [Candidatus Baltobacteraceae bacterium]